MSKDVENKMREILDTGLLRKINRITIIKTKKIAMDRSGLFCFILIG